MNKKIVVIIIPILLVSILFAGCLEEDKTLQDDTTPPPYNSPPVPIITAPEKTYLGENIEFDASNSYDTDGTIISYTWDFGNTETAEGTTVTHTFKLDYNSNKIDYPLVFEVVLKVSDDKGASDSSVHYINLFPREYIFYFDNTRLTVEKPASDKDIIRASFGKLKFNPLQEITYTLPDPVDISPCTWNATIYIEKPRLTIIRRVSLTLYNETGEKITEADTSFNLLNFWKEKTVLINGEINKPEEFVSIKLVVYGFSLREKLNVLYGGEKASHISFDVTI